MERVEYMSKIWVISDWHFCHDKDFIYASRGFQNVTEMNEAIIKNHNQLVDDEDDVYMLGDAVLMDTENGIKCIKQLKGKVHIIRGNHDSESRVQEYLNCDNVVEVCDAKYLSYNKYHFFLSHHPSITSNVDDNKKPLSKRIINICGHLHTTDPFVNWDLGLCYHVECDATECKPKLLDDIIEDIKERI